MRAIIIGTAMVCAVAAARADLVQVTASGTVDFNLFSTGPFAGVASGAPASLSFRVDSNNFLNSPNFPTRGYVIDQSSFVLTAGAGSVGLRSPFPAGQTPYFVLRNNDPAVDGFLISTNVDISAGVPVAINNANMTFLTTFQNGSVLSSLNILGAVGTYNLNQLSVFDWSINIGPGTPMGMVFSSITIAVVPSPGSLALPAPLGIAVWRRRRR